MNIHFDQRLNEYVLCLGGLGNPVLRSKSKEDLERWVTWLTNRESRTCLHGGTERSRSMDDRLVTCK